MAEKIAPVHKESDPVEGVGQRPGKSKQPNPGKAKKPRGDATVRVSEQPPPSQRGPDREDLKSKKRTTDTRGAKSTGKVVKQKKSESLAEFRDRAGDDLPTNTGYLDELSAHDVAYRQPARVKSIVPAPVETHTIKGQKVDVVYNPGRVDPIALKPGRRDAILKDKLRSEGKAQDADAPRRVRQGGDWEQHL